MCFFGGGSSAPQTPDAAPPPKFPEVIPVGDHDSSFTENIKGTVYDPAVRTDRGTGLTIPNG